MMKDRDAAKSKFRKTPSTLNWDSYKNSKNRVNHAISKAKRNHLQTITQSKNQKTIWKELRSLDIVNNYKTEIPAHLADADAINTHFVDSIPPAKMDEEGFQFLLNLIKPHIIKKGTIYFIQRRAIRLIGDPTLTCHL
nr:unnamed protein product [Callosobruchus chinensis]